MEMEMESVNFFSKRRRDIKPLMKKYWYFTKLLGGWHLFKILHTSSIVRTCGKKWIFLKASAMRALIFFEIYFNVLQKNISLVELSEIQYLHEILQTSLTVTNSENVAKRWCFKKYLQWLAVIVFRNERGI